LGSGLVDLLEPVLVFLFSGFEGLARAAGRQPRQVGTETAVGEVENWTRGDMRNRTPLD
jgi:hypothetical protein